MKECYLPKKFSESFDEENLSKYKKRARYSDDESFDQYSNISNEKK
jgi:hypothetical protein